MKLPSIQFYPGDWRKDPGVQALSFHDRGVWFEILCLLHESQDRGKLLLNGKSMPDDALARLLGLDKQVLTITLTNLLTYGVASRDENTGALINRRMVRDEEIRKTRAECGKLGGNPVLLKGKDKQNPTTRVKQKSTPSVSVSSSSSEEDTPIPPRGFDAFWLAFPKKVGKGAAEKAWNRIARPVETLPQILASIAHHRKSHQWMRDNGQFIPNPATWLNQRRWEDEVKNNYVSTERRPAPVPAVPDWVDKIMEIRKLLPDLVGNRNKLAQLGHALPHAAWSSLDGIREQNPLRTIMKEVPL